jgi:hypothetical protein
LLLNAQKDLVFVSVCKDVLIGDGAQNTEWGKEGVFLFILIQRVLNMVKPKPSLEKAPLGFAYGLLTTRVLHTDIVAPSTPICGVALF